MAGRTAGHRKEDRLRRLWTNRLAHQMSQLLPYDDVFREVLRVVRAADLPGPRRNDQQGSFRPWEKLSSSSSPAKASFGHESLRARWLRKLSDTSERTLLQ